METITNKKAHFDYEITDTYEAGIALKGHEVKSIKTGKANLTGSYVLIRGHEAWLINADIPPYQMNNTPADYDQKQNRKLLLSKEEINDLIRETHEKNLTIVPIKLYAKGRNIKLEIGLSD